MQTIAIVNEKGGTGKTTTSVNLSAALGKIGRQVLLVDLDGQAASSRWLGVEEDTSFADALWTGEALQPIPEVAPGVSLAPGSGKLDSVAHDLRPTQGGQLRKLLSHVDGYDYCIIDCPPSLGNRLIGNALLAATHAIVPVETSILALDGLKILLTTFQDVRDGFGHEVEMTGVLACRYDARTKISRFILDELRRALPGKVLSTVIRENVRVRECPASGKSIFEYAPDSRAAEDYMALAKELLSMQAQVPLDEAGQLSADDLAPDERVAVTDLRQQVDALLQEVGTGGVGRGFMARGSTAAPAQPEAPAETADPPQPPGIEIPAETTMPDFLQTAPAVPLAPLEPLEPEAPPVPPEPEDPAARRQAILDGLAAATPPMPLPPLTMGPKSSFAYVGLYDQPSAPPAEDVTESDPEVLAPPAAENAAEHETQDQPQPPAEQASAPPPPKPLADEMEAPDAAVQPDPPADAHAPDAPVEGAAFDAPVERAAHDAPVEGAALHTPVEEVAHAAPVEEAAPHTSVEEVAHAAPVEEAAPHTPVEEAAPAAPVEEAAPDAPVEEVAHAAPVEEAAPHTPVEEVAHAAPVEEAAPDAPVEGIASKEDYPALRAMLRNMAAQAESAGADGQGPGKQGEKDSKWRRLFGKQSA